MKPPCEVIVNKVLPSIRSAIVKTLIDQHKLKQIEIAKLLSISQSAVSQYYTSTRAGDENLYQVFPEINEYAKKVAKKIVKGEMMGSEVLLCEPCQIIRKNQKFGNVQEEFIQLKKCKICSDKNDDQ